MTENRNFSGQDTPDVIDTIYQRCNFSQPAPRQVGDRQRGVRLFPGDDTPRTFIECNLCNAEPPPGSTLIRCLTVIKEFQVDLGTCQVVIDGQTYQRPQLGERIFGWFDPDTMSYHDLSPTKTIAIEVIDDD